MLPKGTIEKIEPRKWQRVMKIMTEAPRSLSVRTNGDHFFFLGELGARETARLIELLGERVTNLQEVSNEDSSISYRSLYIATTPPTPEHYVARSSVELWALRSCPVSSDHRDARRSSYP